jgi:hypothetical protein
MESRYHHDFSQVRIHDDRRAAESARMLGARAYTVGSHIVFGAGEYRPNTPEGQRLLAHELAHVVQEERGRALGSVALAPSSGPAEREAIIVADSVTRGVAAPAITQSVPASTVQRQGDDADTGPTPTPVQTPVAPWSPTRPGAFSIMVESAKSVPNTCFGYADSGARTSPLSSCGYIEHFCSTPARYPLQIRCYTDAMNLPRPQPFQGPEIQVGLNFIPEGSTSPTYSQTVKDSNPRYTGPGNWLEPSFGTDFTVAASGSGQLTTRVDLIDTASGVRAAYADIIRCHLLPCT